MEGLSHDDVATKFNITFEQILAFATGSSRMPPIGFFDQPSICFQNCSSNVIHLPLQDMPFNNFVYYMTHGILNAAGFGQIWLYQFYHHVLYTGHSLICCLSSGHFIIIIFPVFN